VQLGRVSSQAFRPTPKDEKYLSVYDGDLIQPQASWEHFSQSSGQSSVGVMAVTCGECSELHLDVIADGVPFPAHCFIDFSLQSRSEIEKKAKILTALARQRGRLFGGSFSEVSTML